MANTVIALKKSGTPSAIPVDLANGELAINYADGKIFYKSAAGSIQEISGGGGGNAFGTVNANGTLIVSDTTGDVFSLVPGDNITIVGDSINDKITIGLSSDVTLPGVLYIKPVGGDEGGQIELGNAVTNSTLAGNVIIDIYQNKLRFYEKDSPNKGAFIDLSIAGSGVSSNLLAGGTGTGADLFARETANAAYDKANAANSVATSSYDQSNTNSTIITASFGKANDAHIIAIASFDKINAVAIGANSYADSVGAGANAWVSANFTTLAAGIAAYDQANSANVLAYNTGIGANTVGSAAFDKANTAETIAIAAYANSNTKLSTSGGVITGDLALVGNLTVSGNTSYVSVQNYRVDDPLIYLAGNNYVSDIVDIGFIANYVNSTGSNVHTGLYREHTDKEYYLFQGYDQEPINNHIDPNGNNFTLAVLNADLKTSNLILGGQNTITWITSAYDQANAANVLAYNTGIGANAFASATISGANVISQAAFTKANGAAQQAFVTVAANGTNIVADSNNDTLTINASQNVSIVGNATTDDITFDLTNTGVTPSVYGSANVIPVIVVDEKGRIVSVTNVAITVSGGSGGGFYQGNNGDVGSGNFGDIFRSHANTLTSNVIIHTGNNSIAAGPIVIGSGVSLTIEDGARVSIV